MVLAAVLGALAVVVAVTVHDLGTPHRGDGHGVAVEVPAGASSFAVASLLAAAGVVGGETSFGAELFLARALVTVAPGPHLFTDTLTRAEVIRRLARLASRGRARVVLPEGFNRFQIAERLGQLHVCDAEGFSRAATGKDALSKLGITADSAEGYLFPATYDLFQDAAPGDVVGQLVTETQKRLGALRGKYAARFEELEAKYDFHEYEILTLASVVEKEAARAEEQPLIASVFFNRLASPDFRPARSLQSDPTAGYGCLVHPELASCAGYAGKVTPVQLRAADNPYNTYRHPGLPPGPIANPGSRAVEAVLAPADTDYLFFVASGDGRHAFSRTFEEHDSRVHKPR